MMHPAPKTVIPDFDSRSSGTLPQRIALMTNYLLPDRVALMMQVTLLVGHLRVFLSANTRTEEGGDLGWEGLDVIAQRSLRIRRSFRHVNGYMDETEVHIPVDTLQELWRFDPDIIISGEFGGRTLFAILYCMLRRRTKLVLWATLSQRTEAARGGVKTRLRRWIVGHADGAFVNASDGEAYLRGLGYKGPAFQIPYVIDGAEFEGESTVPGDGRLHVLYAGKLNDRKGIVPFVAALSAWCERHPTERVAFTIAGMGPERDRLEALAPPPNLDVRFVGFLDRRKLSAAYHANSIYIFPTLGDEWGLVVNEALCSGIPVLGSIHSVAVNCLVQDGVNGWRFDPSDAGNLHAVLDRCLLTSSARLQEMSRAALESMGRWTPQAVACRLVDALAQVGRHPSK